LYGPGEGGVQSGTVAPWLKNVSVFPFPVRGMRHADWVECEEGVQDTNACAFVRLDQGEGRFGFQMSERTYEATDSLFNLVGEGQPGGITLEFGRKYAGSANGSALHRTPLIGIDLSMNGHGDSWCPDAIKNSCGRRCAGISVSWHATRMPVTLRFRASWLHTHAQAPIEVLVLAGDVEEMLPQKLVAACYGRGSCFKHPNGQRGQRPDLKGELHDMSLQKYGFTAASVLEHVLRYSQKHMGEHGSATLRCQYKSRNHVVNGVAYVRSAARSNATAHLCDDWLVRAGSDVSLLAFSHPLRPDRTDIKHGKEATWYSQHVRWYGFAEILS